jgi:hypothetical protein
VPKPLYRVDGAKELKASMTAAGLKLSDLSAVNKRTADKVVQASKPSAPRRSGALAASTRPSGTKVAAVVRAGSAALPYAPVIHFGWPGHHIAPQPWVYTAAQSTEGEWTGYYNDEIDKILDTIRGA